MYRVVQLNFTQEIELLMFETDLFIFSMTSLKQHIEYFHFRCKIQLDLSNSVAPNEDLITLIGDDDDDLDREVDLSDGGVGEVAVDENANEDRLVTELKDELQMMDKLQESLVREVVLRGR